MYKVLLGEGGADKLPPEYAQDAIELGKRCRKFPGFIERVKILFDADLARKNPVGPYFDVGLGGSNINAYYHRTARLRNRQIELLKQEFERRIPEIKSIKDPLIFFIII